MRKPHETLGFKTRTAAVAAIRSVLYAAQPGLPVESDLIANLLALHPSYADKVGAGIAYIYVAKNPQYPTLGFWIQRVDGTTTDFSFNECLKPSTTRQKVLHACRCAVQPDIDAIRPTMPPGCASCGNLDAHHVDHNVVPFVRLAESWIETRGGVEAIRLQESQDADAFDRFVSEEDHEDWMNFHANNACLQLLCARCNMSKGSR